jgi:hypothetical protein
MPELVQSNDMQDQEDNYNEDGTGYWTASEEGTDYWTTHEGPLTQLLVINAAHNEFLKIHFQEIFTQLEMFDDRVNRPHGAGSGEIQAGKSEMQIALGHRTSLSGLTPIHVYPASAQKSNFMKAVKNYNNNLWIPFLSNILASRPDIERTVGKIDVQKWRYKLEDADQLKIVGNHIVGDNLIRAALLGTSGFPSPGIMLLSHDVQMSRFGAVCSRLRNVPNVRNRHIFSDESHKTCFADETNTVPLSLNEMYTRLDNESLGPTRFVLGKSNSHRLVDDNCAASTVISATLAANLADRTRPLTYLIRIIPRPPKPYLRHYAVKDLDHEFIRPLPPGVSPENDPCLERVMEIQSNLLPFSAEEHRLEYGDMQPYISIQSATEKKDHDAIYNKYSERYGCCMTFMTFNDGGIKMRIPAPSVPSLRKIYGTGKIRVDSGCDDGKKFLSSLPVVKSDGAFEFVFSATTPLHSALDVVAETKSLRPVLIAGRKFAEALSGSDSLFRILLMMEFYRPKGMVDSQCQGMRVLGYKPTGVKPIIYTEPKVYRDCVHGQLLINETLTKISEDLAADVVGQRVENLRSHLDIMKTLTISKKKLTSVPLCKGLTTKLHFTKGPSIIGKLVSTDTDSLKKSASEYKATVVTGETTASRARRVAEEAEEDAAEVADEEDGVDTNQQLLAMRKAYRRTSGKLRKLIDIFVTEEFASISTADLREKFRILGSRFTSTHFTSWDLGPNKYYKVLETTTAGNYNLRYEVITYLNLI